MKRPATSVKVVAGTCVASIARMFEDNNTPAGESATAASQRQLLAVSMRDDLRRFQL